MVKILPANAGDIKDWGSIPGWGRSPGGGHGNSLQYSCLENPMDRGAWELFASCCCFCSWKSDAVISEFVCLNRISKRRVNES